MLIVSEVHELLSGHEYSLHSSWNMSEMRFSDVDMTTNLMDQLEEVGIVSTEDIKVRVSSNDISLYM
jgi:osmotically-inducible protein OsmY